MDAQLLDCQLFETSTANALELNTRERSDLGEEVAKARARIAQAGQRISEAHVGRDSVNLQIQASVESCATQEESFQSQLAMLKSDLDVGEKVQAMSECADSDPDAPASFLECKDGEFVFNKAADLQAQLKSPRAKFAAQRAAKLALGQDLGEHAYGQDPVFSEDPGGKDAVPSDEGLKATHLLMPTPNPAEPLGSKCTVGGSPVCATISDAMATMTSDVRNSYDKVRRAHQTATAECEQTHKSLMAQHEEHERMLMEQNVELAHSTAGLTESEEGQRNKVQEAHAVGKALTNKRQECGEAKSQGDESLCGIRTIREELKQMSGADTITQDCEVTDWAEGECSASCGGGERTYERKVIVAADGGAECPPLMEAVACNDQDCPQDCDLSDWEDWSGCSADCGGGVQQRTRNVNHPALAGGECEAVGDSRQCNVKACDLECELSDWTEWSKCSRNCGGGLKSHKKLVDIEAGAMGSCPTEDSAERFGTHACNPQACPPEPKCVAKIDAMILVDGSGSVGEKRFALESTFTAHLLKALTFGPTKARAGLIQFSSKVELVSEMTEDGEALITAAESIAWMGHTTDTAGALLMAQSTLMAGGRQEVDKDHTIVFMITDGNPNDMTTAAIAAAKVRESARLIVVVVGKNVDDEAVKSWVSNPLTDILKVKKFKFLEDEFTKLLSDLCPELTCSEELAGANGADYVGCQSKTRNGHTCQMWSSQVPHAHTRTEAYYPEGHLGTHNNCRNPDGDAEGIWCYTTDPDVPFDHCDPRDTDELP